MKLQIMSPAADRVDFKVPPAPRLAGLEGKTIGLYNNMTGGADIAVAMSRLQETLTVLEASQASFVRLANLNLFSMLR